MPRHRPETLQQLTRCADAPAGAYPVRNQDKCGGCWAYALAESMRGAYLAQGEDDPGMLSAEFAVDCAEPAWTAKNCSCGDWHVERTLERLFRSELFPSF